MDIILCENCGEQIHNEIDMYGEGDWVLCRSCDWQHQQDWKFNSTQKIIDEGKQMSLFQEASQDDN